MNDQDKTKEQLISELSELRQRVVSFEAAVRDGTRAEEGLRKEPSLAQQYLDVAGVIMLVLDNNGNIRLLNRKGYAVLGHANGDLLGRSWFDTCVPKRIRDEVKAVFGDVMTDGAAPAEYYDNPVITKSGEERIIEWHNAVLTDDTGSKVGTLSSGLDITERRQAEEALRESEERFRQAMEATNDGLWDWNVESGDCYYSPAYSRILGYEAAEFANRSESWTDLLHPDDRAEAIRVNQDCIENRIPQFEVEFRMRAKSGEWRWILGRGKAVCRDVSGRATRMIGTHVDTTDRKRAEEALKQAHDELEQRVKERTAELRASEERFRVIFEEAPVGMVIGVGDRVISNVNRALCHISGYAPQELIGRRVTDFIHPEDRELYAPSTERLFAGEIPGFTNEKRYLRKDGQTFWGRTTTNAFRSPEGKVVFALGIVEDITERKRAEEALRQSEARFRSYFEQGLIGMAVSTPERQWTEVNDRYCDMLGYSRDELRKMTWTDLTHPDDLEYNLTLHRRLLAGDIEHYTFDKRLIRKNGSIMYATVFARCFRRQEGSVDHILALIQDVTERKQAQDALAASEQKYRQLIETTGTGYLILDGQGRVVDANAEYLRICGYPTLAEILGRTVVEWTAPYDVERNSTEVRECVHKGLVRQLELDYVHPDGKIVPVEINATCLDTGDGRRIVSLCRDISERRQTEEALRQSHDELRAMYDSLGDGLLVADRETFHIVRANAAICAMLGYSEDELLSKSIVDLHPKEALSDITAPLHSDTLGHLPVKANAPMLRKDGSVFYADITGDTFTYKDRPCSLGVFRDVTERRQAQEALERERQSLWHMLQASDHERQIISYDIHDGLAQYLAAAGMQFQTYDALRKTSPREARKAYKTALELVKQSHLESRRLISEVRPPIIDEIGLETAISHLVHEQRRRGGPKLECHTSVLFGRLPSILESSLYRIAQEALTNACKHSKSKEVTVTLAQEGQGVRLEVRDWGIGFDPESVAKGHFGLEGIRQRVRLLGGRLTIESTPDSGTLVQVVVPIVEEKGKV